MKVLGIDTILHDACVAVIEDGNKVLSNEVKHTIMSSDFLLDLSILHLKELGLLIKNALKKALRKPVRSLFPETRQIYGKDKL